MAENTNVINMHITGGPGLRKWTADVTYAAAAHIVTDLDWVESAYVCPASDTTVMRLYKNSQSASLVEDDDGDLYMATGAAGLYHITAFGL